MVIRKFGWIGEYVPQVDAVLPETIYWDAKAKRYRYKGGDPGQPIKGTFVKRSEVLALQRQRLQDLKDSLPSFAEKVARQQIGVQREVADVVKQIHILEATLYKGGFDKLTERDLGIIGAELKKQYYSGRDELSGKPYGLKQLVADAPNNTIQQLRNRLTMFGESGQISKNRVEIAEKKAQGLTQKYRILNPADHCSECIYYASIGVVDINDDSVPLPKTRCTCRVNCKCSIVYI